MPSGPITDLAGLKFSAAGKPLDWQRDAEDMYAFHSKCPPARMRSTSRLIISSRPSSGEFSDGASATLAIGGPELEPVAALSRRERNPPTSNTPPR